MNKHDLYFRNIFSNPTRTGELLHLAAKKNNNLAKFLETIDLNSLTEISESYSDGETSGYADLAFTVKLKPSLNLSAELLVGILLEHKSSNKDDTMKQFLMERAQSARNHLCLNCHGEGETLFRLWPSRP